MLRLRREDIIKRFSIGDEIYGKTPFRLDDIMYDLSGVMFIGNKAFYTNNAFMLFAKSLDMPDCEETYQNVIWKYRTEEEENPIMKDDVVDKLEIVQNSKKDRLSSILVRENVINDEDAEYIEEYWEKEVLRSFFQITTDKIIFRKNDLLSEISKLYGREKKNKVAESLAIRIDRESGLLRIRPFRHKKKDLKREEKIASIIPGGEMIVPFFEDNFMSKSSQYDFNEKGLVLRVQEIELIKVFQENDFVSFSFNPIPFDPKEREDMNYYMSKGLHRVFLKGYGNEDSTIRLQLPQIFANYNPMDM